MKKPFLCLMSLLLAFCFACRSEEKLTPEEQRLRKIALLDSTLSDFVRLDSVEGFESVEGVTAKAWLLVDDSTGFIISEKAADEKLYMASITKMMTCLLALENGCLADTVLITGNDCVTRDSWVKAGDAYRLGDLVCEMMMVSDNNAAYAVANHIAGDTLSFYAMMNEKAQYLGMDSTHFASVNGMPCNENYSSASDLVRLSRYCMADSLFSDIVGTAEKDIPLLDGRHLPCTSTNQLLFSYDGCIGIKTGYTRQAAGCLASAATRDDSTLFLVLLGSRSRSSRFKESAILLDYGFNAMRAYREKAKEKKRD